MNWPVSRVRRTFIDFFKGRPSAADGHAFVPSSPVVPHEDPTLLFTNAGMNQFKPIFLGQADPKSELGKLKRAVNSQKCIRAGGKHNDLEDVGKDTYHHTFFEMLGNWSFGEYFKKEAIAWSWELLTKVYGIRPEALYATYFRGEPAAGVEADLETKALWEAILPPERVIPGNMKDNFWMMGDTGPCGPCTEIHVDRLTAGGIEQRSVADRVNAGDPDVIEVWNNVFIQFNAEYPADGLEVLKKWDTAPESERAKLGFKSRTEIEAKHRRLIPLPAKHVDTGMGLERLTSVLQNKRSNYDTDVFFPIFVELERLTGARGYTGKLGNDDEGNIDTAYRVIADHIRTLTFAITDGAVPSNTDRGYVLRRILRRAVRYGRQMLGAKTGFFSQLVPVVAEHMGDAFPELRKDPMRVARIIREEEESFGRTLDRGIKLFESVVAETSVKGSKLISGADAFKLYDTYGFPVDLTALMAEERGLAVDMVGYDRELHSAKEMSRTGGAKEKDEVKLELGAEAVATLRRQGVDATEDYHKFDAKNLSAKVVAILDGQDFVQTVLARELGKRPVGVVLNRTNFYAEMGGQEADHGRIAVATDAPMGGTAEGGELKVEGVKAFGGFILHVGPLTRGEISVGDKVMLHVDKARRVPIEANHTATHLVNLALRKVLGEHVNQRGSLVAPDRMRFDFDNPGPVTPAQLGQAEDIVRRQVTADLTVFAQLSDLAEARKINGLRAVFGEAYPDPVRVVSIGQPVPEMLASPDSAVWREVSVEFCGGTHVQSTGAIGAFALISEEAVAKGVRRIVAVSGVPAEAAIAAGDEMARRIQAASLLTDDQLADELNAIGVELEKLTMPSAKRAVLRDALAQLQERVKAAAKKLSDLRAGQAVALARSIADSAATSMEQVIVGTIEVPDDRGALLAALKVIRDKNPRAAAMLMGVDKDAGKIAIVAAVPEGLVAKGLKAGDWVREAAAACGGKGGGKPDAAQGGGSDLAKLKDAVAAARAFAHKVV
jgi:alanyl-tRNA synthetase